MDKEEIISMLLDDGIDKIASDSLPTSLKDEALKKASIIIKAAAITIREADEKITRLSSLVNNLYEEKQNNLLSKEAEDIANSMFDKGLIKKAELNDKIDELKNMDKKSIEIVKDTINKIPNKFAEDGISSLTFLYGDNNIEERKTLEGALNQFFK